MKRLPIGALLRARRRAVADGELRHMWPGAIADVAGLVWFRGILRPVQRAIHGPGPDEIYHSPTGGCPHCNIDAPLNRAADVLAAHGRIEHSRYRCRCLATWDDPSVDAHARHLAHVLADAGLLR